MSDLQAGTCGRNWKQRIVSISSVWRCGKTTTMHWRLLAKNGRIELPSIPDGCVQNAHMFYIKLRDIDDRAR